MLQQSVEIRDNVILSGPRPQRRSRKCVRNLGRGVVNIGGLRSGRPSLHIGVRYAPDSECGQGYVEGTGERRRRSGAESRLRARNKVDDPERAQCDNRNREETERGDAC